MPSSPINLVGPASFPIAVQTLVYLARARDDVCPSAEIAGRLGAHAVYLRRVVAQLVRAGLVEAREGRDGGYRLARPADHITLADVFRALQPSTACDTKEAAPRRGPMLDPGMQAALSRVMGQAERRALDVMQQHTLADLVGSSSGAGD
ncbi:MAG: RrF2 family transcriptional regulator [Ktedonobacterales bacterium]